MKLLRPLAALVGGALLLAGCGGGGSNAAQPAASAGHDLTPVSLTLNWYPYGEHAPFYYGLAQGIFAKHGIDLKIQAGQGSGKTVTAVGADQTDFGWADTPALMAAAAKGVPVKSVGVFLQTTPAAVQFFGDAHINSPADLKGKTIASTAGDALSATFPAFLKANGMSINDVTVQNTDAAGKIAAVISGRTDALLGFAHDQGPTIADKAGKPVSYLRFADYGVKFLSNGLIASDKTIAGRGDLVREMVAATSEAFSAAAQHPEDAVAAMDGASQQLPPKPVLLQSWQETMKLLNTDATKGKAPGVNDESDWQQTIDVFTQAGMLPSGTKPADFWNAGFAPKG
jgi:NitT/TauT family transport system substrate-binding protein